MTWVIERPTDNHQPQFVAEYPATGGAVRWTNEHFKARKFPTHQEAEHFVHMNVDLRLYDVVRIRNTEMMNGYHGN